MGEGHLEPKLLSFQEPTALIRKLFTRENVFALVFCLILILVVIVTADTAPQWIYQGF